MANTDNLPYISPAEIPTAIAAGVINSRRFVKIAPGGVGNRPKVVQCTALTDIPFGVSMTDAALGAPVGIWRSGVVPVETAGALSAGAVVWPDANGMAAGGGTGSPMGIVVADAAANGSAPVALKLA